MFVPIDAMLKMTGETMVDPKNYFLNMGFRVFSDDCGVFYLIKNAAILYVRHSYDRMHMLAEYKPQDAHEASILSMLNGPMDNGFEGLKEVYK